MFQENNPKSLECFSSAVTLSDMEVFIFPELLYSLVLANSMSGRLWKWLNDPWFGKNETLSPLRRMQRLKQYIMDHFAFNLDLDTWGLTTKERELDRFSAFISPEVLARSNALFGYEGDKYYFTIDIRKHFGLDKYTSSAIPYWKTESLEAMESFRHKSGYSNSGAGECVSLSTLYAAAAFAVAKIPLDDIFIMTTPLHSQGFLDVAGGIITNNRRIVTKTMWFNGTEITAKARRAIENEQVTIVAHKTGYIHSLYPNATIAPETYSRLETQLRDFLSTTTVDFEILTSFLRTKSSLQRCFQLRHTCSGKSRYIEAEKVFSYEHNSKSRVSDHTSSTLLGEIEEDEYYTDPLPGRIALWEVEVFFKTNRVHLDKPDTVERLKQHLQHACYNIDQVIPDLEKFCRTEPRLPDASGRNYTRVPPINLDGAKSAEEVRERVAALRGKNETADLAFAAFRDLSRSSWKPFVKAALERNPVSLAGLKDSTVTDAYETLNALPSESIFDEPFRIAQPDEVWNFQRGDGIEKAITLANVIRERDPEAQLLLEGSGGKIVLRQKGTAGKDYSFESRKKVEMPAERDFFL
jgi:hypothetical protein